MSVTFADIRAMLENTEAWTLSVPDTFPKVTQNLAQKNLALPPSMEKALGIFAAAQNTAWPAIKHPRAAFYASAHDTGNEKTQNRLQDLAEGKDVAVRLCGLVNADLRVYELDMTATQHDEASLAHALSYGLMAADDHVDVLIVGSVSADFEMAMTDFDKAMSSDPLAALKT